jgi:hypothetical protein
MNCATCLFWRQQNETVGLCRRAPPTPILLPILRDAAGEVVRSEDVVSFFPTLMADGWCGEHRPIVNGG